MYHLGIAKEHKFLFLSNNWGLLFNPLTTNVPHLIETKQLICIANLLTGFCRMENIGR